MSAQFWHCDQIPHGDEPVVACQREVLERKIKKLEAAITEAVEDSEHAENARDLYDIIHGLGRSAT